MRGPCSRHFRGAGGGPCQNPGAQRHAQRPPGPRVGGYAWTIGLGRIPGGPKAPHGGALVCISAISGVPGRGGTPQNTHRNSFLFYNSKICYLSQISVLVQMNPFIYHASEQFYCSTDQKKRRPWLLNKGGLPFRTHTTALKAHQTPPAHRRKMNFN